MEKLWTEETHKMNSEVVLQIHQIFIKNKH